MSDQLPDGLYPFANAMLPLSDMTMTEAPSGMERLLRTAAAESGIEIMRDRPVELVCASEEFPDARFLVFWPSGEERLHILAPKTHVKGRA